MNRIPEFEERQVRNIPRAEFKLPAKFLNHPTAVRANLYCPSRYMCHVKCATSRYFFTFMLYSSAARRERKVALKNLEKS